MKILILILFLSLTSSCAYINYQERRPYPTYLQEGHNPLVYPVYRTWICLTNVTYYSQQIAQEFPDYNKNLHKHNTHLPWSE